jgi:hypothetical protein
MASPRASENPASRAAPVYGGPDDVSRGPNHGYPGWFKFSNHLQLTSSWSAKAFTSETSESFERVRGHSVASVHDGLDFDGLCPEDSNKSNQVG